MAASAQPAMERKRTPTAVVLGAVALLAFITYLPVFDDFFISDDFVYLTQIRMAESNPAHLLHIPPGFYRLTGHLYFFLCYEVFGLHAAGYHAFGLLLHIAACLLVYALVARLSGRRDAALAAALFFAAYERHHEAVLWISAASELTAAIAVIGCVLLWREFLDCRGVRRWMWFAFAMLAFAASLLSKESSVVVVALLIGMEWTTREHSGLRGGATAGRAVRMVLRYLPAVAVSAAYLYVVYASNPIVRSGFYAVGARFPGVYARTLNTLLLPVALAVVVWLVARGWRGLAGVFASNRRAIVFFLAWLLITPLPFCFATYIDQAPSRQTYLPSIGTAALAGLLAAELLRQVAAKAPSALDGAGRGKRAIAAMCIVVLIGNAAYVWKKDRQFEKRGAPTRLLVDTLRQAPGGEGKVYIISGSEYYDVISRAAIALFTDRRDSSLVFVRPQDAGALRPAAADFVMQWDDRRESLNVLRRPPR